jgi:hypothetical protein
MLVVGTGENGALVKGWSRLFWLAIALLLLSTGCAPWSSHMTLSPEQKIRIAVLPVKSDVEIMDLRDIETIPETNFVIDEQKHIQERMREVTQGLTRAIEARLNAGPYFSVIPDEQVAGALGVREGEPVPSPLSEEQIESLGGTIGAEAVLAVRLTGYGRLKRRWVVYLIGTGVVEGLVEGTLAAGAVHNVWAGVVVGGEEIVQEILTWGGGSYLFNRYYSPVTLEGDLYSTKDGESVWSDTAFDSIDRKALKTLPEEEQKKKEVQLRVTVRKTERDLLDSLEKAARKNGAGLHAAGP